MPKPILALDFDGVLHSYSSGWKGPTIISDPPVPGAFDFIVRASERFEINIYSSRSTQAGGIDAMQRYLFEWATKDIDNQEDLDAVNAALGNVRWPTSKPPAMVSIDDRALTFNGVWSDWDVDALAEFRPWNKQPKSVKTEKPAGEPMQQRPRARPIRL